ncbi:hypothetical protein KP509_07G067300 [Ceratopteris richardii]|nr:hypothetical protein KP509_07G067300 [Ceratopteris richardii]
MQKEGLFPNATTFSCVLRACGSVRALDHGRTIHAEIARRELLCQDAVLGNALIDMYAKCGAFAWAWETLDELIDRDVVCWTSLISGYCQWGFEEGALHCFEKMQREGISPNAVTYACMLQACGNMQERDKGSELHTEIVQKGLLERDAILGNALVDMYAKCGALAKAKDVFDKLSVRDIVSWTSLITGYVKSGCSEEALKHFDQMKSEGLLPNAVTLLCILQVCGDIGAAKLGELIHAEIIKGGLQGMENTLETALVDMYAKCAVLTKAKKVFYELPLRNVVSWTSLMSGYTQAGRQDLVFDSFRSMMQEGVAPNLVTFMILLASCSCSGLVSEGETYFEKMSASFGIIPSLEHHTCMVDLFGRAGHFDKALEAIIKMPSSDHLPAWFALLNACQKWGNTEIGNWAYKNAVRCSSLSAAVS